MLSEGYAGPNASDIRELNRRAAWVSTLMQSPAGELATGGRSSQHQWNEPATMITYECARAPQPLQPCACTHAHAGRWGGVRA